MSRLHLPVHIALASTLALAACSDDESIPPTPVDAAVIDAAPAIDAPAIDAPPIDAPTDATPIDAAIDAALPPMLNGCTAATAVDRTAINAVRTVTFPGFAYAPPCIKIKAGQAITWSGDLGFHPLRPGAIEGGVPVIQAGNPILAVSAGVTASTTFPAVGDFGYYCANHFGGGMFGAIYVVP